MGSIGANRNNATTEEREQRINLGYDNRRLANIERVREASETRRIAEEAQRENARGSRSWTPTLNQRITDVSHQQAQNELFNAPVGTVISMENHNTGDYVGEYTRTADGWEGSQRYKSGYIKPGNVTTANGFAMQVSGNDITVTKVGRRRR